MATSLASARRSVALFLGTMLAAASLVFVPPAVAVDEPQGTIVVDLDAETAFALDPANIRAIDASDAAGTVQLTFPAGAATGSRNGYIQVFRAGPAPVEDRWVGTVHRTIKILASGGAASFPLPPGEYELFMEGFAHPYGAVAVDAWSWHGGGYDVERAATVHVEAGGSAIVDLAPLEPATAGVSLLDSFGEPHGGVPIVLYASIERDGRRTVLPVATVPSGSGAGYVRIPVLADAEYTLGVAAIEDFPEAWLGGVSSAAAATVRRGSEIRDARLFLRFAPDLGRPVVKGVAVVGEELTAEHGLSPFGPRGIPGIGWQVSLAQYAYQWLADGVPISGQTERTMTVTTALAGKRISFVVTGSAPDLRAATATSLATPRASTTGQPRLTGSGKPGERMSLSPGTWPSGTGLRYQWLLNGLPIAGARSSTLTAPSDASRRKITVLVTATRAGYETVVLEVSREQRPIVHPTRVNSAVASEWPAHQEPGSIYGYVRARGSAAVRDAHVRILAAGTGVQTAQLTTAAEVITDAYGYFEAQGLAPGNYCVLADAPASTHLGAAIGDCRGGLFVPGVRVFAGAQAYVPVNLWPEPLLKGTVSSAAGKVAGAVITVYTEDRSSDGSLLLSAVASSTTNASGAYVVGGLEGNRTYRVHFRGPSTSSHVPQWWASQATARAAGGIYLLSDSPSFASASLTAYVAMGVPKIKGALRVGGTLTASHSKTKGATYAYKWYANGTAISKATKRALTLTKKHHGKTITVRVVGKKSGYATTSRASSATAKILLTTAPKITGRAKAGATLTAARGVWTSRTSFSYQWYAGGKAIPGADRKTFIPSSQQRGKVITVKVTGRKAGYATYSRVSPGTARVSR